RIIHYEGFVARLRVASDSSARNGTRPGWDRVTAGYCPTSRSSPLHPNGSWCARKKKRRHLAPMRLSPWKLTRAFIRHPEPRAPRCGSWTPRKAGNGGETVGDMF